MLFTLPDSVEVGTPPIEVTLKRSARARRLSLRVSRLDGRIVLSVPPLARQREIMGFLNDQVGWMRAQLGKVQAAQRVTIGARLPIMGQEVEIAQGTGRTARRVEDRLEVRPSAVGAQVKAYLRLEAQTHLRAASDRYAAALGVSYARLTLRDTRSRWGSCSSTGGLMYSWRLIMAPQEVLNYVAAHEVAHLREMNHSARFWALVADLDPDYARNRAWLRHNGDQLHAWRFEAD